MTAVRSLLPHLPGDAWLSRCPAGGATLRPLLTPFTTTAQILGCSILVCGLLPSRSVPPHGHQRVPVPAHVDSPQPLPTLRGTTPLLPCRVKGKPLPGSSSITVPHLPALTSYPSLPPSSTQVQPPGLFTVPKHPSHRPASGPLHLLVLPPRPLLLDTLMAPPHNQLQV